MDVAGVLQPSSPIIVKLIEPRKDPTGGLAGVLVGALGLSGALALLAIVIGTLAAGLLFWFRRRNPLH